MPCMCAVNSIEDATNTGGIRRRAYADIRRRLNSMYREVRQYVKAIPREQVTIPDAPRSEARNAQVYRYDLTDRDTNAEIRRIVDAWFDTGADAPPPRWFFGSFTGEAFTSGTAAEAGRVQGLASGAGALSTSDLSRLDVESILQTRPFRARIDTVARRAFEEMRGFSGDTATDLARTLADGVSRGSGIREITADIRDRFEVAESRAQRIARTEIGHSYRDARNDTTRYTRDEFGLNLVTQWVSALAPTTRRDHAARHLKYYTPEQNAAFYSVDGNQINCLCRQQSVLVQDDGSVLGAQKMTKRDRAELDRLLAA